MQLPENSKNSYFPKRALPASLLFGVKATLIFLQGCWKVWISVREQLSRIGKNLIAKFPLRF